jgi:hypothetical protein
MKDTYVAPTLLSNGQVVCETSGGWIKHVIDSIPLNRRPAFAGSAGFDL